MNKKGFTLIELLAVIVILAIIALIATPIILNMINEARKSAAKSSTLGYVDSIEAYTGFRQLSEDTELEGYDVDLPSMTNGKVTCTKTSSGWNSECEDFFEAVDKKNKGKAPDIATIIISESGKVQNGTKMKYNGYEVNYDGNDAYVGDKAPSNSSGNNNNNSGSGSNQQTSQPQSFANDNWSTIAANTTSDKYHVGDEKEIQMDVNEDGNNETYHIMIVNMNPCTTEESESACGMVLQFKELLVSRYSNSENMYPLVSNNSSNFGGWKNSLIREVLNSLKDENNQDISIYSKLPNDLKNVIISTKVISGHGENTGESNYTTNDKLYLLSPFELGFNANSDTSSSSSRKLDYYPYSSGNDSSTKREKKRTGSTEKSTWWTRTAAPWNKTNFIVVGTDGSRSDGGAGNNYGVSPAFRIGTN